MRVRDIMTASPHTLSADATLSEAVDLMNAYGIRHLPVVERGKVVGIISDRDIKMALGPDAVAMDTTNVDARLLEGTVEWFMSEGTQSIDHEAQVSEAGELFLREKIGALPVLQDGELVGILSVLDVLRIALPILREAH